MLMGTHIRVQLGKRQFRVEQDFAKQGMSSFSSLLALYFQ
jgi:hypothetical protein